MRKLLGYIFLMFVVLASCKDDEITTDPSCRLEYSSDTVRFDTIFGGMTTPYQTLKVYNNSGERINISSIDYTAANYYFMININGRNSNNVSNVEIADGDSLYIFVKTNGECSGSDVPFALLDSISFSYNGNVDYVYMSAFSETPIILDHFVVSSDTTLSSTQPYFIKDTLKVEEGATLNIDAGVRLYFNNGASLYVDGSLNCNGNVDNQIEMRYFRNSYLFTDTKYYLAPGNWKGVVLSDKSGNCKLLSTNIIGASCCLKVDSASADRNIIIGNCQIYNAKQGVLVAEYSNIYAFNTLFANGGNYNVDLTDGTYLFNHCTVASFLNFGLSDLKPSLNLHKKDSIMVMLNNSIICGDKCFGTYIDDLDDKSFRLYLNYCGIQNDSLSNQLFYGNQWSVKPGFTKTSFYVDFKVDSLSPFRTLGSDAILKLYPECATDILGKSRVDEFLPDVGAYEY